MAAAASASLHAWGAQGHRVIGLVAEAYLTDTARQEVARLLDTQTLADIATWADDYRPSVGQTALWHFVDIPPDASAYDRDRDCPKQPEVIGGIRTRDIRDCVVDRILDNEQRLANASLDRADRAIALKFLVHFIGDLHQPFHAIGPDGGSSIPVVAFGSPMCTRPDGTTYSCNLHALWDTVLIARRGWTDRQYANALLQQIRANQWESVAAASPGQWATDSFTAAKAALVPPGGTVDEAYYRAQIAVIDQRLALAGLRLAAFVNRALDTSIVNGRR
jgi:hypothetical protein